MNLVVFLVILSILVFVHELGHFLLAKRAGIKVEEFGFGLPPRAFGKKIGETLYSINWLPIGGFVKLFGEDGLESRSKKLEARDGENTDSGPVFAEATTGKQARMTGKGRAFFEKTIWQRLSVLVAGVVMNLLLGITCFTILYLVAGVPVDTAKVRVVGVTANSPAEAVGLQENDVIVSVDGEPITKTSRFSEITKAKLGLPVSLEITRENATFITLVTPRSKPPEGEGPLGVVISSSELKFYPWWQMPYFGAREGLRESLTWGTTIVSSLGKMVAGLLHGQLPRDVAGPIGIYQITGQATRAGWQAVVELLGILSINLAIVNILPLPALDGGRVVFLVYEAIAKRKVNPKFELWVNNIGMIALLSLMVLITINDVLRLIGK